MCSTETETEITVIIPSSKLNDPEFVKTQLCRAKLRILIEVSHNSDRTIESLITEFIPNALNDSLLLHEFNLTETGSNKTVNLQDTSVMSEDTKLLKKPIVKLRIKPKSNKISKDKEKEPEISGNQKPSKKTVVKMRIKNPKVDQQVKKPLNPEISGDKKPPKKLRIKSKLKAVKVNNGL